MDSIEKKEIHVDGLFEQYLKEESCLSILSTFTGVPGEKHRPVASH
jgi:hypothetical protein